jgi:hypothetical protein
MSRSYKHVGGWKDRNPWAKRQANRRVRRTSSIASGKAYRKVFNPWNISDYKFLIFTKADEMFVDWIPNHKKRMK